MMLGAPNNRILNYIVECVNLFHAVFLLRMQQDKQYDTMGKSNKVD